MQRKVEGLENLNNILTHPPVQNGTETFFISMIELNNAKL